MYVLALTKNEWIIESTHQPANLFECYVSMSGTDNAGYSPNFVTVRLPD